MANVTVTVLALLALSSAYVEGITNGEFYDILKSDIHSKHSYFSLGEFSLILLAFINILRRKV